MAAIWWPLPGRASGGPAPSKMNVHPLAQETRMIPGGLQVPWPGGRIEGGSVLGE